MLQRNVLFKTTHLLWVLSGCNISLLFEKLQVQDWEKTTHQELVPAWAGDPPPHPFQKAKTEQRTRARTADDWEGQGQEQNHQSSPVEAVSTRKPKKLVLGQRALEQETPVLWLHTWHDQSDPVTDERPWSCTYRTSCASQTYRCLVPTAAELLTCWKRGDVHPMHTRKYSNIYKLWKKKKAFHWTQRHFSETQSCHPPTGRRCVVVTPLHVWLGHTTDPAVLRKCCLSQSDTSCPEIRRAISKKLAESWHWVGPGISHNSTTVGAKQIHSRGDATQQ